jgi:hypothetical protein
MCAKKLRYPPPMESEGTEKFKPKSSDMFIEDVEANKKIKNKLKEVQKTYKPKLATYLQIILMFMVIFEISIFIAAGSDYKYFSIYAYENDLDGSIQDADTDSPIHNIEFNITLENYDHEFTYLFSEVEVEDKTFYPEINNTTGEYKFNNVPCGRYILKVHVEGYNPEHRKVIVVPDYVSPEDDENTENFYLARSSSGNTSDKMVESGDFKSETLDNYIDITYTCFVIIGIFVIILVLGMIYCFRRKRYSIAITGAIFGILAGLITFFSIGSIIGVGALILIMMSKEEFES